MPRLEWRAQNFSNWLMCWTQYRVQDSHPYTREGIMIASVDFQLCGDIDLVLLDHSVMHLTRAWMQSNSLFKDPSQIFEVLYICLLSAICNDFWFYRWYLVQVHKVLQSFEGYVQIQNVLYTQHTVHKIAN